jgi:secreted trypsin-like serine protease
LVTATIVGSNNLIYGGTSYRTLSAKMHPDFSRNNRTGMPVNDIGIITLAENVKEATKFPKRRRHVFKDYKTPCKLLGKGTIGYPKNYVHPNKLKLGLVKQVPKSICVQEWRKMTIHRTLPPHLLCMTSDDSAACAGDSGGPLLCNDQLTSIIFFSIPCGTGLPDLYVDILPYNGWIDGFKWRQL